MKVMLQTLLQDIVSLPSKEDMDITGIAIDSRKVKPGDLFVAYKGVGVDGRDYIQDAIARGAVAVIVDPASFPAQAGNPGALSAPMPGEHLDPAIKSQDDSGQQCSSFPAKAGNPCAVSPATLKGHLGSGINPRDDSVVPLIPLPHCQQHVGELASRFYGEPSKHMTVIGVTGTNGKTTCTQLLAQAFQTLGYSAAVIGTLGVGFLENLVDLQMTTPDPILLQKTLCDLRQQGAEVVAIEVSSHALDQGRVAGVAFDVAVFTNLTRDHLDYHPSIEAYAAAKKKLFDMPGIKTAVINRDDAVGRELIEACEGKCDVVAYGVEEWISPSTREMTATERGTTAGKHEMTVITAKNIQYTSLGAQFNLLSPYGEGLCHSSLLGVFNVSNVLSVMATLLSLKILFDSVLNVCAALKGVNGRMHVVQGKENAPLVIVDYAHTPDALAKLCDAARAHTKGRLICTFGCGGDRDKGKRSEMGAMVTQYADVIVVTSDNPRSESPEAIIADILKGVTMDKEVIIEPDRAAAIQKAVGLATPDDVVVVAGKGHETYQQIGKEKIPFSDVEEVEKVLCCYG